MYTSTNMVWRVLPDAMNLLAIEPGRGEGSQMTHLSKPARYASTSRHSR